MSGKRKKTGLESSRKNISQTRFTRVSLRAGGINEHFEISSKQHTNHQKEKLIRCSSRQFMKWAILFIAIYNIIFIPLQFGYRIEF
jgi:hypothetical protein